MKTKKIKVPFEIDYLTKWKEFDSTLPQGKVILNKNICGCGCTEYYLCNDMPVILVSPRKELLHCKMDSDRERELFYFDRSKSRTIKPEETIKRLEDYLCNPFQAEGFVPKILVTYDSLKIVVDTLRRNNCLNPFTIVVDEFSCLFTDVMLKGFVELNLIHMLNQLPNHVVYISATPINEVYLDELEDFKNIPYVTLEWDARCYETVKISWQKMINTRTAISNIINKYKSDGFFMAKIIDGYAVYSREAVFFLNSVNDIVAVISACNLSSNDTLVICADDQKNRNSLNKVGFTIGHVPGKRDYKRNNKTFTFVTKASFEGTDFYSDNSTTYIFADSNRDNLALDISIDLPQIIGRCRTKENPFRDSVSYYYKTTTTENLDVEAAKHRIDEKMYETERLIGIYENIIDPNALRKLTNSQIIEKYKNDYVDMQEQSDGTAKAVCNKLAWVADLRAIEIKSMQYKTTYSVLAYMESKGFETENYHGTSNDELSDFYNEFMQDSNFQRRMKCYADTIDNHPELRNQIEGMAEIPLKYKSYYNTLGTAKIRSLNYKEAYLEREVCSIQSKDSVIKKLREYVTPGGIYSNADVKNILRHVYQELNISQNPKASLLPELISVEEARFTDAKGVRQRGYKIL